jgi:hypothetical protein
MANLVVFARTLYSARVRLGSKRGLSEVLRQMHASAGWLWRRWGSNATDRRHSIIGTPLQHCGWWLVLQTGILCSRSCVAVEVLALVRCYAPSERSEYLSHTVVQSWNLAVLRLRMIILAGKQKRRTTRASLYCRKILICGIYAATRDLANILIYLKKYISCLRIGFLNCVTIFSCL